MQLAQVVGLPYTITIGSYADIQTLECDIRALMRCQGSTCAFLQSAEYRNLTFAMTRELISPQLMHAVVHIPHSNLVMNVSASAVGIKIFIQAVSLPQCEDASAGDDVPKKRRRV